MKQPNLFTGAQLRDKGIKQAIDHADQKDSKWSEKAYKFLTAYIGSCGRDFMVEDVRRAADWAGLTEPPSKRAWGGIIVRAKKAGLISRAGFRQVKNPKAHCTPATVWKVEIF